MARARFLIIIACVLWMACSGRQVPKYNGKMGKGSYYTVKSGDTLWEIATANKITAQQIAEWNNIQDPDRVSPGMKIFIPKTRAGSGHKKGKYDAPLAFDRDRFSWPVPGHVISGFGMRDGNRHDGVDIKSPSGTAIRAAGDGHVVYAGNLRGYGNLIIIRHADRFYTTYAHNQKNLVKVGAHVTGGEVIATVGATGRATGPHLHFEVRVGATARNPLFFMPTENNALTTAVSERKRKHVKFSRKPYQKSNSRRPRLSKTRHPL